MKVLVTGFEPFGGETVNPAQQIVERLPQQVAGAQVVRRIVPVSLADPSKLCGKLWNRSGPMW